MSGIQAEYRKIALEFATALTKGNFDEAHSMLSPDCRTEWSPEALRRGYEEMLDYASTPATNVELVTTLEDWPAKQANDIGWAYVAVSGADFGEAVSVVVATGTKAPQIRDIEWGRP